ncbi:UDP-N-acetylmuramoyl-L-alanyl-D-glutamate--2,6-diaminopimelate ligase [Fluviispira sanaruensis]|uniref:UDP-N-acetylmuramoyl-L-alanyl-D-glutamate--2,6-diaminopimelate ligase n=1 Tax=Fluviispira sanaruensis TaxID=2493639 RepID=A0A4P2VFT0_FLUSA|nr:UDP-N-acetylmuramoyl-L-alanyl-D-glutamate--2,6-diaminopimelate ligase [Fluviispira sanaruensis]BBH51653.1 UDP-N-acetylmuramoyl-L-alanyl-D-glutamate--2, 6-diaminopimelate ligase [Fluviispira sanaruensis]
MSLKFKLSHPKISMHDIFMIKELKDILISHKKDYISNSKCEIFLNSVDAENYLKIQPHAREPHFIYIARRGNRFNGNIFAEKILESGNIFIGNPKFIYELKELLNQTDEWVEGILSNPRFIAVNNIELSINYIIEYAYNLDKSKFQSIGITGTNGKTSVTQITGQIFEQLSHKDVLKIGTLGMQIGEDKFPGSHVTTPDYPTLLSIINAIDKININKIIMETTSHGLKENRLGNWKVDTAVFTNLTQDHLDYHKTMLDYKESKEKLFSQYLKEDGTAIICTQNDNWTSFVENSFNKKRTLIGVGNSLLCESFINSYKSYFNKTLYLYVKDKKSTLNGISGIFCLDSDYMNKTRELKFHCPLIGDFQFENILSSIACAISFQFDLDEIISSLKNIKNIPGRLEVVNTSNDNSNNNLPTVLIDYAHTPDALEKAILVCKNILKSENKGKIITVFGCGGDRDKSKRPLMGKISSEMSDITIITSDNPRTENPEKIIEDIYCGVIDKVKCLKIIDRKSAIESAIQQGNANDLILVAGKGHEDYQIIGETKHPFSDALIARSVLSKEKK